MADRQDVKLLSRNKGLKEKKTETNNIVKSFCLKFSRDIDVIYAIFLQYIWSSIVTKKQ